MKTMNKIVAFIFAALAVVTLACAASGARHQIILTGLCTFIALVSWPEKKHQNSINQIK